MVDLMEWATDANRGDHVKYHVGQNCGGSQRLVAMFLSDNGLLLLTQKRRRGSVFDYIATRSHKKWFDLSECDDFPSEHQSWRTVMRAKSPAKPPKKKHVTLIQKVVDYIHRNGPKKSVNLQNALGINVKQAQSALRSAVKNGLLITSGSRNGYTYRSGTSP